MRDVQNVECNPPPILVMPFPKGPIACKASSRFGLASQEVKDIVFRFIVEYSSLRDSLRDFGP
jgi:hypothetical protein